MNSEKTTLEVMGESVEDAIEKGLDQLGLPRSAVDIETLDEGNHGFLGLGNKQARIRLTIKDLDESKIQGLEPRKSNKATKVDERVEALMAEDIDELEELKNLTISTVEHLVTSMNVKATVSGRVAEPEDDRDHPIILVEINGNDLSVLIGRRSETLNALQFITNLILNQKTGKWVPLMLDVQGYRFRRERQLRQLARKMADQVVQTRRKQILEPMPANERRIIHLELRYHPFVTTESTGEEPNRRIAIFEKPRE